MNKHFSKVMTISEIAKEFGISDDAVREAASKGWIPARKSGNVWLIDRSDAIARWGGSDTNTSDSLEGCRSVP